MNNTILIGNLTRDPELRYLPNGGTAVCDFTIAVSKDLSKDKRAEFEAQGKPTADFIKIVAWGKMGENSANFLSKGKKVAVEGRIQTGSYTAEDGNKKYTFEVVADSLEFLSPMTENKEGNTDSNTETKPKNEESTDFTEKGFDPVDEDDIPF